MEKSCGLVPSGVQILPPAIHMSIKISARKILKRLGQSRIRKKDFLIESKDLRQRWCRVNDGLNEVRQRINNYKKLTPNSIQAAQSTEQFVQNQKILIKFAQKKTLAEGKIADLFEKHFGNRHVKMRWMKL